MHGPYAEVPANTLRALLDPLAPEIEPTKMGLPSKQRDSDDQLEESGRTVSWGDGDPERRRVGRWQAGRRQGREVREPGRRKIRRQTQRGTGAEEERGRKGQIRRQADWGGGKSGEGKLAQQRQLKGKDSGGQ